MPREDQTNIGPGSNIKLGWVIGGMFALTMVVVAPAIWAAAEITSELRQMNTVLNSLNERLSAFERDSHAIDRRVLQIEGTLKVLQSEGEALRGRTAVVEKGLMDCWTALREHMIRQGSASVYPSGTGNAKKEGDTWVN